MSFMAALEKKRAEETEVRRKDWLAAIDYLVELPDGEEVPAAKIITLDAMLVRLGRSPAALESAVQLRRQRLKLEKTLEGKPAAQAEVDAVQRELSELMHERQQEIAELSHKKNQIAERKTHLHRQIQAAAESQKPAIEAELKTAAEELRLASNALLEAPERFDRYRREAQQRQSIKQGTLESFIDVERELRAAIAAEEQALPI